jgi:hypothetical protein
MCFQFFIMPILKLIIAPFVCLIMMVVIGPAEGGVGPAPRPDFRTFLSL